ncbi:MAG: MmcQ/YjbR family DNA-binding protein [Verrucomicrobia bacterium]|nr:MmcQ/YjbR family DNA-binding protein [Verrucomicrobiota bacterium]
MDLPEAIDCCLKLKGAEETTPFGPEALVYKVGGKMFALGAFRNEVGEMNLKCDPERALELRDRYEGITPGYHMSKKHWNTVRLDGSVPGALVREMIGDSYALVVAGMTRKQREGLKG